MHNNLNPGDIWISKKIYDDAERDFYESLNKNPITTPLAEKVAQAREQLKKTREFTDKVMETSAKNDALDLEAIKFIEKRVFEFQKSLDRVLEQIELLNVRVTAIEQFSKSGSSTLPAAALPTKIQETLKKKDTNDDDDDDIDLFGSDSEDESTDAAKIREQRLAAYATKKSKKAVIIAKSNVILDIKPWDDETDMKLLEENVRNIKTDGLLWGASKLQPLAYGIYKLQISCVVEDELVSIDWLTEKIESIEELVQSVDIAAFNKI